MGGERGASVAAHGHSLRCPPRISDLTATPARADKPAYTITGSGGGGTHVYHWNENRALTNRERARLQTFPDEFVFSGSKESARKQIGMAVPPLSAKIIFEAVLKSFAGIDYPKIESNVKNNIYDSQTNGRQLVLMEEQEEYVVC